MGRYQFGGKKGGGERGGGREKHWEGRTRREVGGKMQHRGGRIPGFHMKMRLRTSPEVDPLLKAKC